MELKVRLEIIPIFLSISLSFTLLRPHRCCSFSCLFEYTNCLLLPTSGVTGYLLVLHLLVVQALVPLPCGQMLVGQKLVVTIACEVICLQFSLLVKSFACSFLCLWAKCLWLLFACDHPYYFKRFKTSSHFCLCMYS